MPSFWKIGHAARCCIHCLHQVLWLVHSIKDVPWDIDLIFFNCVKFQSIIFINMCLKLLFPLLHKSLNWEFFNFFLSLFCLKLIKPERQFFLKFNLSFGNLMVFEYFHFKLLALAKYVIPEMLILDSILLLFGEHFRRALRFWALRFRFTFNNTLKL